GEDVSVVAVEVRDVASRLVPIANNEITFKAGGPGRIIGVGNGDPSCHEPDKPLSPNEAKRSAFNGLAMAIVQALKQPGEISVEATADGLEKSTIIIKAQNAGLQPAI